MQWNSGIFCLQVFILVSSVSLFVLARSKHKSSWLFSGIYFSVWQKNLHPIRFDLQFSWSHKDLLSDELPVGKVKFDFLQSRMLDNMLLLQFDGRKCCCQERIWTSSDSSKRIVVLIGGVLASVFFWVFWLHVDRQEVMIQGFFLPINHLSLKYLHYEVLGFRCLDNEYCDSPLT